MIETVILLPPPDCHHSKQTKFSAVNVFVVVDVLVVVVVVVIVVVVFISIFVILP